MSLPSWNTNGLSEQGVVTSLKGWISFYIIATKKAADVEFKSFNQDIIVKCLTFLSLAFCICKMETVGVGAG